MIGNDKQCFLLIASVKHLDNLCTAELVDNGIQCDIPAEQCTGDQQHNDISDQDIIPGIYAFLLGQIDTDEIRTACCCTDI